MDKDLLSNDFTRNIDLTKIDKNIAMIKVVLVTGILYYVAQICIWLKLFLSNLSFYLAPANFHYIILFTLVIIPLAILLIVSWFWYLKASRLMKLSIETNDAAVFNKAYSYLNRSSVLSIIGSCLSLLSTLVTLFIN